MSSAAHDWPQLDEAYTDEFGEMNATVYALTEQLWPSCRRYARDKLGDEAAGQRLLCKAAVQVSRRLRESAEPIENLAAYLRQSFNRLVLAEMRERARQHSADDEVAALPDAATANLDDIICFYEILARLDADTRQIFELLLFDHTYEEIAARLGQQANVLRSKVSKAKQKIRQQLKAQK